jgi:sigma-E factor negative regulatory protein RseC
MPASGGELIWQPALVVGERPDSRWLEFRSASECERCARGEGCGAGLFARLFTRGVGRLALPPERAAMPGDRVFVGVPGRWLLGAATVVYLAPAAAFVAGAWFSELARPGHDGFALVAGLAGAAIALVLARALGRSFPPRLEITPRDSGRLESAIDC